MATPDYQITVGDWGKIISATAKADGEPVNLSGATLTLLIVADSATEAALTGTPVADADQVANKGKWVFTFTVGSTDGIEPGDYHLVVEAEWIDAKVTFPTPENLVIRFVAPPLPV